jgi:tetratricopeptide (TPR) repeat protein
MSKVQQQVTAVKKRRPDLTLGVSRPIARHLGAAFIFLLAAACASPEEKLENYTSSGAAYLVDGDLGRANIQFQNALKINEEYVPALSGLVDIAEKKSDFKSMFGLLQRIVRLEPENLDAQVKLGKLYLVASDETTALEHAENALAINPNDIGAITLKAAVQLKLGDNAGAVELARRALAEDPANPEAVTVIATERTLAGEYEEALAELDNAIAVKPDIAILQLLRISLLGRLGREEDVRAAYVEVIRLFPEEPAYRRVYVTDLIKREEFAKATSQLEKIVELEPDNLDAKLDVVRIVLKNEGEAAATARIRGYVDAEPDNTELKFALVEFLRQQGDVDGVAEVLSALAQSDDMDIVLQAKNQIASEYLRKDERDQASAIIEEILSIDERNTDALIKRAGLLITDGDYDTAILDLRTALDNSPDSAEAMVLMALAFEQQGNPSFARAEFAKAFKASEQNAKIGNAFAKFHLRQEDSERAEQVLVESLASNPGDLNNLKLLAGVRLSQQNWRGAEEVAEIIARLENQDELAERIRSAAFSGLGDYDRMIETLTEQNANEPLASRPLATLVAAYLRTDRSDEAQKLLLRIISSEEDNYAAHILLAQVYGAKQQPEDAENILLAAVERDGSRPEAYELLYRYYQRTGQSEKAVKLIEDGLATAPDSTALRVFKADGLLNDGNVEEAFAMYEDLVVERPENRVVANNFVSLSSDLRRDAASIARALEVAKILEDLDNPLFQDTVGWAYYRAGDFDKAVEYLSKAAQGASQNAEIVYHLGAAYFAAGDNAKAKMELEKALETGGDGFKYADEINVLLGRL